MGLLLLTDTTQREVHPAQGNTFTLAELQGYVDGYIEVLSISEDKLMIVNEDGNALGLETNLAACAYMPWIIDFDDEIVGNVLIINPAEMN